MIIYYSHFLSQKYIFIASNLSQGLNRLEHVALCKVTSRHGEQIKKIEGKNYHLPFDYYCLGYPPL